jgi:CDP-diacylglycerol--glycerol-3-phosphate 3-phosphatidyltransferase
MPETISKYGSDNIIYYITNKISPYLCVTSPNLISVIGFLFVFPILYNYSYNRSMIELMILAFMRQFFDCLDGSVARVCNKTTKFGAKLDISLDVLTYVLLGIYLAYRIIYIPPKNKFKILILILLILSTLYSLIKYMYDKFNADKKNLDMDKVEMGTFVGFCHDNSIIVSVLGIIFVKVLIK